MVRSTAIVRCCVGLSLLALAGCASLPDNTGRTATYALQDTDDTQLARWITARRIDHGDESGFQLLGDGLDAFLVRAVLAQSAERSIDAQYYLLHNDLTGHLFIDQLLQAADRGVRVRLLVDDMDLDGRDMGARLIDAHPNVEVRFFNPFSRHGSRTLQLLTRFGSVTRRMHNKSFTVDNQITVLGGRNIGDEYFEANPQIRFNDLDVMCVGPVAGDVATSFDRYWNHPLAYPVARLSGVTPTAAQLAAGRQALDAYVGDQQDSAYLQALRNSPLAGQLRSGEVDLYWDTGRIVADDPEKLVAARDATDYSLSTELRPLFERTDHELIIFSPYFVPGREGTRFLSDLAARGVRVRILTNSLASTDVAVVHAGYARYRKDLLRAGVELYEMDGRDVAADSGDRHLFKGSSKASLHAKSFVMDREEVFIGSLNLDPRSVIENSEIGVIVSNREVGEGMAAWFDANVDRIAFRLALQTDPSGGEVLRWHRIEDGGAKVYASEPYATWLQQLVVAVAGLLPIESQL